MSKHEGKTYTILPGLHIWKGFMEFFTAPTLSGYPYWEITKDDNLYWLWELDTNTVRYHVRKSGPDFDPLWEEGLDLDQKLRDEKEGPYLRRSST